MHFELGGVGEHGESAKGFGPFGVGEAAEKGADAGCIEDAVGLFDSKAGGGKTEIDAACIGLVADAEDIAGAD